MLPDGTAFSLGDPAVDARNKAESKEDEKHDKTLDNDLFLRGLDSLRHLAEKVLLVPGEEEEQVRRKVIKQQQSGVKFPVGVVMKGIGVEVDPGAFVVDGLVRILKTF